jgi:hypothetical protein
MPESRFDLDVASVSRYASGVFARLLARVRPLRYPSAAVLDILTLSVQHFDAQPALDVHGVSFLVFGTWPSVCRHSSSRRARSMLL